MNYKMIGRFFALILAVEAVFMIPALAISAVDGTHSATRAFLITIALTLLLSAVLAALSRGAKHIFFAKEGLFCVGVSWILMRRPSRSSSTSALTSSASSRSPISRRTAA